MLKRFIALAATALFSMNASAGYVQYNFDGPMSGSFVQREDNQALSYFNFAFPITNAPNNYRQGLYPAAGEGSTRITGATTYSLGNGPTNFDIYSDWGGDQRVSFGVTFAFVSQGVYEYTAHYAASVYFSGGDQNFAGTLSGRVNETPISSTFATALDGMGGYYDGVSRVIPTYINSNSIPEPGSWALLAAGVLAAGMARKRRSV